MGVIMSNKFDFLNRLKEYNNSVSEFEKTHIYINILSETYSKYSSEILIGIIGATIGGLLGIGLGFLAPGLEYVGTLFLMPLGSASSIFVSRGKIDKEIEDLLKLFKANENILPKQVKEAIFTDIQELIHFKTHRRLKIANGKILKYLPTKRLNSDRDEDAV